MTTSITQLSGNLVDVLQQKIYPATIHIENERIVLIEALPANTVFNTFILPGFVDAHVHIESSMLTPTEFGRLALCHGTVATVSDPHEIANVLGIKGVEFMLNNAIHTPLKICFGAPSCVPATAFETAGAELNVSEVNLLLNNSKIGYLSEMMNFPGVLNNFPICMDKINAAKKLNKPIDGHAPGLRGKDAEKYINVGISTDHECFTIEEALEKIKYGMKILIREGSAAKNFEALIPLIKNYADHIMFCSDDKHPNDLITGHINDLVVRALQKGYQLFDILKVACINPVLHYKLAVGLLQVGDFADCIVVNNLQQFKVLQTYCNGILVAENGKSTLEYINTDTPNNFNCKEKQSSDFSITAKSKQIRVIEAIDGELITNEIIAAAKINSSGFAISDTENDILKIAVVNRYENVAPAIGFIKNFGLKQGAIAGTVAHDSHNIIAVGATDTDICNAVNAIIAAKGGLAISNNGNNQVLALPIAGILTNQNGYKVANQYSNLDLAAKQLGCKLKAPFMTLSFMALLVIPSLKLSDKGLFNGTTFTFTNLFV